MTDTTESPEQKIDPDVVGEINVWLEKNWDPDLTVGEWWELLGLAGWSHPALPTNAYGHDLSRGDANAVAEAISAFGALGAPGGLGLMLAAPTIASHGNQEQIDRYVRDIVTGQQAWCQLFSEPGAGSDLAGIQARAIKDGDQWIVNGQKVWTSGGQVADMAMLIARTNSDVPKHQGISYFALDMHQEGVDTRPLREMTGRSMFNEVFMSEAITTDDELIGDLNNGWAVANTTLANERASLGSGGGSQGSSSATPGTVAGHLEQRVGDFVSSPRESEGNKKKKGANSGGSLFGGAAKMLVELAKGNGKNTDPNIRQDLMRLHTLSEIGRMNNLRVKAEKRAGIESNRAMPNISKLAMSQMMRLQRDLGLQIVGAAGMLHAYDAGEAKDILDEATGNPFLGVVTEMALFAQAPPIYGGTDEIQRNIIGERVLGLPKEPNNDKTMPFSELPKNA